MNQTDCRKFLLLDRDGVLNVDIDQSVCRLEDLSLFPESLIALKILADLCYTVVVITNQACVGRGNLSAAGLEIIHQRLRDEVAQAGGRIDDILVCPHLPEDGCSCRKPLPGLIIKAQQHWGFDPATTWFVGDDVRDVQAAIAGGCRPALVLTGKGRNTSKKMPEVPAFLNLLSFVQNLAGINTVGGLHG